MNRTLSPKNKIIFIQKMSFLIGAGVSLLESIQMIYEQTESKQFKKILRSIEYSISNGQSLAQSLSAFPTVCGEFAIHIIHSGESTGMLSENLAYLATEMKKRYALQRKIIGACIYPALVTLATCGITAFLIIYLFPKIIPVFKSLHMTLPLSTRMIITASIFISHYGYWVLGGIMALSITVHILFKKHLWLQTQRDAALLKIPIIGNVIRSYNLAHSTRTLGLLLKSGTTLHDALPITTHTTTNRVYRNTFTEMEQTIDRGGSLSKYFSTYPRLFPTLFHQVIAVGERSGNLPQSLIYLSEMYENEVDEFTKNLSSTIEPLLMILMGTLVGFIAISIITPIYGITQNLHK